MPCNYAPVLIVRAKFKNNALLLVAFKFISLERSGSKIVLIIS